MEKTYTEIKLQHATQDSELLLTLLKSVENHLEVIRELLEGHEGELRELRNYIEER